jgi:hypothetical protein
VHVPLVAPEQEASLPWCKDAVCSSLIIVVKKMNTTNISLELGDM